MTTALKDMSCFHKREEVIPKMISTCTSALDTLHANTEEPLPQLNIGTVMVMPPDATKSILDSNNLGERWLNTFVKERLGSN